MLSVEDFYQVVPVREIKPAGGFTAAPRRGRFMMDATIDAVKYSRFAGLTSASILSFD